jgi:hypothetical protein
MGEVGIRSGKQQIKEREIEGRNSHKNIWSTDNSLQFCVGCISMDLGSKMLGVYICMQSSC